MKSLNNLYCFGTNCECKNCNKKWVVTYKELVKYKNIKKKASNEYLLGAVGAIGALTTNNRLNKINNTSIANSAYTRANYIDATANEDYIQDKYCPECKSPNITAERFYYIANNKTYDFVQIQKDRIYECLQPVEEKVYHQMTEFDYEKNDRRDMYSYTLVVQHLQV